MKLWIALSSNHGSPVVYWAGFSEEEGNIVVKAVKEAENNSTITINEYHKNVDIFLEKWSAKHPGELISDTDLENAVGKQPQRLYIGGNQVVLIGVPIAEIGCYSRERDKKAEYAEAYGMNAPQPLAIAGAPMPPQFAQRLWGEVPARVVQNVAEHAAQPGGPIPAYQNYANMAPQWVMPARPQARPVRRRNQGEP